MKRKTRGSSPSPSPNSDFNFDSNSDSNSHSDSKPDQSSSSKPFDPSTFSRPKRTIDPDSEALVFQLLECEDASKGRDANDLNSSGDPDGDRGLIRLHGATESGDSVIVLVKGFGGYVCLFSSIPPPTSPIPLSSHSL